MVYTTLYLCRHGQTEANRDGILQGTSDYPLTELGLREAKQTGKALSQVKFSRVMSSDLLRAARTCRLIMQENEATSGDDTPKQEETAMLREIGFGLREGRARHVSLEDTLQTIASERGVSIDEIRQEDESESAEHILQRQNAFLQTLRGTRGKVLAVAHGAFIKNFLKNFVIHEPPRIANCSVSIVTVEFDDDELQLTTDGSNTDGESSPVAMRVSVPDEAFLNCGKHMDDAVFLYS